MNNNNRRKKILFVIAGFVVISVFVFSLNLSSKFDHDEEDREKNQVPPSPFDDLYKLQDSIENLQMIAKTCEIAGSLEPWDNFTILESIYIPDEYKQLDIVSKMKELQKVREEKMRHLVLSTSSSATTAAASSLAKERKPFGDVSSDLSKLASQLFIPSTKTKKAASTEKSKSTGGSSINVSSSSQPTAIDTEDEKNNNDHSITPQKFVKLLREIIIDLKENQKRCFQTRDISFVPLFPQSLKDYHPPLGSCRKKDSNFDQLRFFDFDKAWERKIGKFNNIIEGNNSILVSARPFTPSLDENLRLFYFFNMNKNDEKRDNNETKTEESYQKWLLQSTTYSLPTRSDESFLCPNHRRQKEKQNNNGNTHNRAYRHSPSTYSLRPNHDLTYLESFTSTAANENNNPKIEKKKQNNEVKSQSQSQSQQVITTTTTTRIWDHLLPDTLRLSSPTEHERAHAGQLRMLAVVVAILEKHNMRNYFLSHGSLLGAYRDEALGFIPHDVDIDLAMPQSTMNYLKKIWRSEFPRDMMLQSETSDPGFYMYNSRRSAMRIKDRYSCAFGVPSVLTAGKHRRIKLRKIHQAFGLDLIPLEKKNKGQQYKILSSFFNSSDIYPLSTICFGGVLVQAPKNVLGFLEALYGKSGGKHEGEKNRTDDAGMKSASTSACSQGWEKMQPLPAHFGGIAAFPYLATTQCGGSIWALNFTRDYGVGYDKLKAKRVLVNEQDHEGNNDDDDDHDDDDEAKTKKKTATHGRCVLFPREDPNNG